MKYNSFNYEPNVNTVITRRLCESTFLYLHDYIYVNVMKAWYMKLHCTTTATQHEGIQKVLCVLNKGSSSVRNNRSTAILTNFSKAFQLIIQDHLFHFSNSKRDFPQ